MKAPSGHTANTYKILIADAIGLRLDKRSQPDASEVKAHVTNRQGHFHEDDPATSLQPGIHFFYNPGLSTSDEILKAAKAGQYDAIIVAASFVPPECKFPLAGVRIGAGTGNMASLSWGGTEGQGGDAVLMNTPGFNARATAQMVFKALLRFRPDLPLDTLHQQVVAGEFDTGRDLVNYTTSKLEGTRLCILGYGHIGREVARLSKAFAMDVVIYARESHRKRIELEGFSFAKKPGEAAQNAEIISCHLGLGANGANTGLINNDVLHALAPKSLVINYDRGELVDPKALEAHLATGHVQSAAVDADIFKDPATGELRGPLLPYIEIAKTYPDRVLLTPHVAADTDHPSRVAGAKQAVDQIFDLIESKAVTNLVGTAPLDYTNRGTKTPAL